MTRFLGLSTGSLLSLETPEIGIIRPGFLVSGPFSLVRRRDGVPLTPEMEFKGDVRPFSGLAESRVVASQIGAQPTSCLSFACQR